MRVSVGENRSSQKFRLAQRRVGSISGNTTKALLPSTGPVRPGSSMPALHLHLRCIANGGNIDMLASSEVAATSLGPAVIGATAALICLRRGRLDSLTWAR